MDAQRRERGYGVRQLAWLKENQYDLAVAAIPVITVVLAVYFFATWPSPFEQWMTSACNGLRDADTAITDVDHEEVSAGEDEMSALVPASEMEDADAPEVQRVWAGWESVQRSLKRWDEAPGPDSVSSGDRPLIDRAVETCSAYDYPWYSPYQVIASP